MRGTIAAFSRHRARVLSLSAESAPVTRGRTPGRCCEFTAAPISAVPAGSTRACRDHGGTACAYSIRVSEDGGATRREGPHADPGACRAIPGQTKQEYYASDNATRGRASARISALRDCAKTGSIRLGCDRHAEDILRRAAPTRAPVAHSKKAAAIG